MNQLMDRVLTRVLIPFIASFLLWNCYPDGPEFYEDMDITFTSFERDFDFQARSTYSLPNKIVTDVEIKNGDTTYIFMKDIYAIPILEAIEQNMADFGWEKVAISESPDVVLTPGAIRNTTLLYSYWYNWWYGGYYPGWGWYYPPFYTVSSYTTGSMIITMSDPNVDNPINLTRASWIMVGNGLLSGTGNIARITDSIDQAFIQSPYLKLND
ncbi:hypothetical protein C943_00990 [Mariniradius saccharolyticus AK6]|uniref:DUF4136 domain-containing protein n=1 Tax=Mariniradius saccharolyticus AK6 TaxID=1239962 RepID=M7XVW2_9BACT|nr:DUF4136 domain-containing protein [Mariniradius saccharolyticus]EMS32637.1 hypothetical protein C943_00990 [Mariniradius saccharolyticus AK6]